MQDYPISLLNAFAEDAQRRLQRERADRALDARMAEHAEGPAFRRHLQSLVSP